MPHCHNILYCSINYYFDSLYRINLIFGYYEFIDNFPGYKDVCFCNSVIYAVWILICFQKHFDSGDYAMERAGAGGSKPAGGATPETGETSAPPVVNKPAPGGGVPARRFATSTSSKLAASSACAPAPPSQLEVASAGGKMYEFAVSPVTPTSPTSTSPTGGAPALTHEAVLAKRQALGLNPALLSRAAPGTSKLSPSAPPVSGLALFESATQPQWTVQSLSLRFSVRCSAQTSLYEYPRLALFSSIHPLLFTTI